VRIEHYHSGSGYETPEQKHTGLANMILKQRKKLTAARRDRIVFWRLQPLTDVGLEFLQPELATLNKSCCEMDVRRLLR